MSINNKVIWSEGMFLRPQHFQQQERYLEFTLNYHNRTINSYNWGINTVKINPELLLLGKLSISNCSGIFPDGTVFDVPNTDLPPNPIDIPEGIADTTIYLTLPLRCQGIAETSSSSNNQQNIRYNVMLADALDTSSDSNTAAKIQIASPNLQLSLGSTNLEGYTHIGIGKIKESTSNHRILLDEAYIPPCMNVKNIMPLSSFLEEILGLLHQRGEAFSSYIGTIGHGGISEIEDFLLLQLINKYESLLDFYFTTPSITPKELYILLTQLLGELSTFTMKTRRRIKTPIYQHENLQESFAPVIFELRRALSRVSEQHVVPLPLEKQPDGYFISIIGNKSLLNTADFFLAVGAAVPPEKIQSLFPALVKVAPVEQIKSLVSRSLSAIKLQAVPVAPRQLPFNSGYTYFKLDQKSNFWKQLEKSSALALHVAGDFPELEIELWAIKR